MKNADSNGMVLLMSLVLAFLGLIIVGVLAQLFSTVTWLSGGTKRYALAVEAAYSAVEDFGSDVKKAFIGIDNSTVFYGTWNDTVRVKLSSVAPEDDISTNSTVDIKYILSHCDWSATYGDYKVCVSIVYTKTVLLQGGEVSVYQNNPQYSGVRKFISAEIVAYRSGTAERAWLSIFEVLER